MEQFETKYETLVLLLKSLSSGLIYSIWHIHYWT
jgi:hypothetical protein